MRRVGTCRPCACTVAQLLDAGRENAKGYPLTDRRRGEGKELKKDQQVRREVLQEIGSEIAQDRTTAQYRNPNRDGARGLGPLPPPH